MKVSAFFVGAFLAFTAASVAGQTTPPDVVVEDQELTAQGRRPTSTTKSTTKPATSTTTSTKTTTKPTTTSKTTTKQTSTSETSRTGTTKKPTSTSRSTTKTCTTTTKKPSSTPTFWPRVTQCTSQLRLSPTFHISATPRTRYFNWFLEERWGNPDGFWRKMFVINGCFPGPIIEANQGDTIIVRVTNLLDESTGIHWHGMTQNGTQFFDGPVGITQCPIQPGDSYTYKFTLDRPDQYGTYWWHAHKSAQYADGVSGPLIIHSPRDPLKRGRDYDVDQIIHTTDWYHDQSSEIVAGLLSGFGFNGTLLPPLPSSNLLNGRGSYNCSKATSSCTNLAPLEIIVPTNSKIRFRFINAGTHATFKFSVDKHPLTVIEADDTPVTGPVVHRVPFGSAQRYSVVIDTRNDKHGDSFVLRARMNVDCFGQTAPPDFNPEVVAYIRVVQGSRRPSSGVPASVDWNDDPSIGVCVDLDEALLKPIVARNAPTRVGGVGVYNVAFNFTQNPIPGNPDVFGWTLNSVTMSNFIWNPLAFQVHRGQSLDPTDVTYFVSNRVEGYDIVVNNLLGADHPFHLHSLKFFVVARGNGALTKANASSVDVNTVNPLQRDTIQIPTGTWVILRVITDIPGVHAFHCHIVWHQAAGLFGVFVTQPNAFRRQTLPTSARNLCHPSNYGPGEDIFTTEPGRKRSFDDNGAGAHRVFTHPKMTEVAPRRYLD